MRGILVLMHAMRKPCLPTSPKTMQTQLFKNLIGDICISMKAEDYLQLPDCVVNDIPVVLDEKAQRQYDKLEKEMLLEVLDSTIDAGSAAILSNKLLQLCNGAVYDSERKIIDIHDCKIEAFLELVEQLNGQPALVFYNFKHDLIRIKKALEKSKLRVRQLQTPQDETDWNNREIDILLAHPASAAYGLNLQDGGNHVVWFGLNWSLESILCSKAKEYATADRLHNFKVAGALQGISPVQALMGMMLSTQVSVADMCMSGEAIPQELWDEKITG